VVIPRSAVYKPHTDIDRAITLDADTLVFAVEAIELFKVLSVKLIDGLST
jgi:hypothetical protein